MLLSELPSLPNFELEHEDLPAPSAQADIVVHSAAAGLVVALVPGHGSAAAVRVLTDGAGLTGHPR